MKRKLVIKTTAILLAVTFFIVIVIIFSQKTQEILTIKNKAKAINEASQKTSIDVTYLEDNLNIGHEHIFKTMYDENEHWEECTICKIKQNQNSHSFVDNGWTYGVNSCHEKNVHKFSCRCGYSYTNTVGRPTHNYEPINYTNSYDKYNLCNKCSSRTFVHKCYRNDGVKIDCLHLGTCKFCNYTYTTTNSHHGSPFIRNDNIETNNVHCENCNTELGYLNYITLIRESDNTFRIQLSINFTDGNICNAVNEYDHIIGNHSISKIQTTNNGTSCIIERRIIYNENVDNGGYFQINFNGKKNGMNTVIQTAAFITIDEIEPTITKITMENGEEELTEWSRTKPINIFGTENYCKSVSVKIIDDRESAVFEGTSSVIDGNYSISCTPELEINVNGRTFKAIVTDSCGNIIEKEFTISKVDAIAPIPISGDKILGDWAKSKDFKFIATDYGIGQVKIAFNDIEDLGLATEDGTTFSRDYTFTGDVYKEKQLSVLYKDGLGNTSIQKIVINQIDNTAPTITNIKLHNNKLSITSHDEHKTLGEGSGVVKYRYLASEKKLINPKLTSENSIEVNKDDEVIVDEIYKIKYIYIVAEDYVGNISEVYEFEVPQLVLTSTVNLSATDGKGEVILDWSTYDISDKYFVIYRKKDNQTEWDTIVPLTQKLTGSTYTDTLGNDMSKPESPNITITGDAGNNNINVIATSNDNGTKYTYYIEAYDSTGALLAKSN